jgi:hypothetical protein
MPTTWQNPGHTRGSIRAFCWYLEPSVHCPGDAHPKTSINCVHMIQSVVLWTCLHNHVTAPLPSTNRYRFSTKSVVVSFLRSQAQCPWWLASSYTSASGWTLTTGPRRTNCWGIRSWHWRTWNNMFPDRSCHVHRDWNYQRWNFGSFTTVPSESSDQSEHRQVKGHYCCAGMLDSGVKLLVVSCTCTSYMSYFI